MISRFTWTRLDTRPRTGPVTPGLHQRRPRAAGRIGEPDAITSDAESDLLLRRGRRDTEDWIGLRRFVRRCDELIAASMGGADEALVASVVADRLTRRLDPAGERRLAHEAIAPDDVEQFLFRHDPVPFSDQYGEEVEHLRLNRPGLPAPA